MDSLLALLDTYGVALLFVVILLKEIGVPVPVPGDLLMVVAGARAATGQLPIVGVLLAALVGGILGAYVQYLLARGPGRGFIYRFGKYVGLTPERLDRAADTIKGRGWVAIALGRALPGLRIGAVAACGLAPVPMSTFLVGLTAGTVLFVGFHALLGYFAGPGVGSILDSINIPIWPVLLALAIIGLVGWLWIKAKSRRARGLAQGAAEPLIEWADACCPVCLAAARLVQVNEKLQVAGT
jgi:membrane protein DedA with SNARE-associated domain